MADIVLVYPPYQGNTAGRSYSPLGLPYIAAVLEQAGYSVRIVDSDMEGMDVDVVAALVRKESPAIVGLSVLTHTLPSAYHLVQKIRKLHKCVIAAGGAHVTADPQIIADLNVPYGIRGEAEYGFLKLADYLFGKRPDKKGVDGLISNDGDRLEVQNPCFIEDINTLPKPARHLIKTREYKYTLVFSSRGCPYRCVYCAEQCRNVRYRNPEDVVEEITGLYKSYGIRSIDFGDSVFTINREHAIEVCRLLADRKLPVSWSCITRADLTDRELLKAMKDAGCGFVSFGVESGVERIRRLGGKNITNETIREAFRSCRDIGLRTRASILFGNPGETVADMRSSIAFVKELKPDYALFSVTQVFPGTGLFQQLEQTGATVRTMWKDFMLGKRVSLDYLPDGVSGEDVYRISREAFRTFYMDAGYLKNKLLHLSDVDELKEAVFILLAKAHLISIYDAVGEAPQGMP
jgi:anaerobic magnesium-protoporphyrin IX monomethyl ester cyclase